MMAHTLAAVYGVQMACDVVSLARSSYYYEAQPDEADQSLRQALVKLAGKHPTYGYRRLTVLVRQRPGFEHTNHKRVQRVMAQMGLQARKPRRFAPTTDSHHGFPRYPNLVAGLDIVRPDQVWVSDITRVVLGNGDEVYLAIIMDVFTRAIRGWELRRDLSAALTLGALERATCKQVCEIHHSDQGVQYAATPYTDCLTGLGAQISMADVGCAWQNGFAERVIRTLKEEEIRLNDYHSFEQAYRCIKRFIEDVYNRKRIHSALGYLTPAQFEAQWLERQAA